MNKSFSRTPTGVAEKWRFYSIPTIWVEGPTDIFFYSPLIADLQCRLEAFHGCTKNKSALIDGLVNDDLPYMVILDGDYEILKKRKPEHKRVIRLKRYSFENYLWEPDPVNRVSHRCAQNGDVTDVFGPELNRLNHHLTETLSELIILDVAARRLHSPPKVLPDAIQALLIKQNKATICTEKVAHIKNETSQLIDAKTLDDARIDVTAYLKNRPLADLLNGHILFGLLRLSFIQVNSHIKGGKYSVDNDSLTQLLSDAIWNKTTGKDHKNLRMKIRKSVMELIPLLQAAKLTE